MPRMKYFTYIHGIRFLRAYRLGKKGQVNTACSFLVNCHFFLSKHELFHGQAFTFQILRFTYFHNVILLFLQKKTILTK